MKRLGISLLSAALLAGCVLGPQPRNSRFKVDITDMEKATFLHDTWIYRHPTKRVVDYQKFILPPITVYENSAKKIKDREPYERLSLLLSSKLHALFSKTYTLVDDPGEGVLRLEVAVVDVKPIVKINKGITDTILLDHDILGSKLEMNCFDSVTGEEVFAISTLYKGDEFLAYEDASKLPNIEAVFEEWTAFLKEKLDEAMRKQNSR